MTGVWRGDRRAGFLALAGVAFALSVSSLGLGSWLSPGDSLGARLGREAVWWAIGAFMLFWVLRVERLPLASIGIKRPTWGTLG